MGVQISEIIPRKEIELGDLKGKVLAVDAFNTIYQFLTTIRQPDGTPLKDKKGRITSHLSGLFYRNINLMEEGIKLVYVFDGEPLKLKGGELARRKDLKIEAKEKYEKAVERKDYEAMRRYSGQMVRITDEIVEESKELLDAMGILVVQARNEGEAEASALAKSGLVWAIASQDYDALLYGAPRLVRNLTLARRRRTSSGMYVEVKPELVEFEKVLNGLDITLEQLICLGILVGTDYNPGGVYGIGQKKALEIVKRYKHPVEIFEHVEKNPKYSIDFDWKKIFEIFHSYKTRRHEIKFKKPSFEKLRDILLKRDFSETRVESGINRLRKVFEKGQQKGLGDFL